MHFFGIQTRYIPHTFECLFKQNQTIQIFQLIQTKSNGGEQHGKGRNQTRRRARPFNRDLCDAKGAYSLAAAEDVYYSVFKFARNNGADGRVPKELVELFAVTYSRWVQVEKDISKEGFTAEHPTTGAPCKSPLVDVSNTYSKQAHNYWYSIWSAIKDSEPDTDHDDMDAMLD